MTGDKVSAMEAERIGMIYKTIPMMCSRKKAGKIAETLSQMPTKGWPIPSMR